ncbi:uncharacterized protein B0H64DRAFT_435876 [Chaetomium fimeti]|uniref:Uncharacterized protein n=1 Tax=Chaetomium fimeti TaxID=1854472 RepID=A0AAE0LN48_9PEZI|nr:hypothetical protein B0H64DRAFT_435876 [Chaetomium fimeti]
MSAHASSKGRSGDDLLEIFGSDIAESGESPVKDRINLFENMGRPPSIEESARPMSRVKGSEPSESSVEEELHVEKRQTWQRRLASQTLRSVSLTGRRKLRKEPKSRIPVLKKRRRPTPAAAGSPSAVSTDSKRESSFSFKATLRKISKSSKNSESRLPSATATPVGPRATPSIELLNKTAKIAPRPFHRTQPIPTHEINGMPTQEPACNSRLTSRTQHANDGTNISTTASVTSAGVSWGRRAAAVALDIGRRFKTQTQAQARKASSSGRSGLSYSTLVNTTPVDGDDRGFVAGGYGGEWLGAVPADDAVEEARSRPATAMSMGGVAAGYDYGRGRGG